MFLVYQSMAKRALEDNLHHQRHSSSAVAVSRKMRIDVLLDNLHHQRHLQRHAVPPVIHREIKLWSILLDSSWVLVHSAQYAGLSSRPLQNYSHGLERPTSGGTLSDTEFTETR
jgi:hypothetical protein